MPTKAKSTFDVNIQRASYFLDIHAGAQRGAGAPKLPLRELPRGAIVFAVGAIDAYLSEVSAEIIVRELQENAAPPELRELLRRIQTEIPTLALEIALLATQRERVNRIREAVVEHFYNNISNHGSKAVARTVRRIGGKPADLWSALGAAGYREARQKLDRWTDIRHRIVHQGKKPGVWREHARGFIDLARAVVSRVDQLAADAMIHGHGK